VSVSGTSAWTAEDRRQLPLWKIPLAGLQAAARGEDARRRGETTDRSSGKSHRDQW
jgi:hypothetical protein